MSFKKKIKAALRAAARLRKPLVFGDLHRVSPVSPIFGLERGTPIDRYYIEQFLNNNRDAMRGRCLEVAEINYLSLFGAPDAEKYALVYDDTEPTRVKAENRCIGDLTCPESLKSSEFDCFVCTQTLQFIFDVGQAISGSRKLLADDGVFLGTVSCISQISRYDMDRWGDFWRFTPLSIEKLLRRHFFDVRIESFGNSLAAQAFLQGLAIEDLPDGKLLDQHDPDYPVTIGFRATGVV